MLLKLNFHFFLLIVRALVIISLFSQPCIMCAMALTHARARRIIYALPNALGDGGCGGRPHRLPCDVRTLNHKFVAVEGVARRAVALALAHTCGGATDAAAARACNGGGC